MTEDEYLSLSENEAKHLPQDLHEGADSLNVSDWYSLPYQIRELPQDELAECDLKPDTNYD